MSTSTNTFTFNANVYTGSFTKKDGTTRNMRFLKENAVPSSLRGSGVKPRYLDTKHEVVFDLDQNGWRVFNHNQTVESPSFSRQEVTINGQQPNYQLQNIKTNKYGITFLRVVCQVTNAYKKLDPLYFPITGSVNGNDIG